MVNRNLLRQYESVEQDLDDVFDPQGGDWLPPAAQASTVNKIVSGRILRVTGDQVWVDVGYKSEGLIELREWYDEDLAQIVPPRPGDEIEVLLDATENHTWAV